MSLPLLAALLAVSFLRFLEILRFGIWILLDEGDGEPPVNEMPPHPEELD